MALSLDPNGTSAAARASNRARSSNRSQAVGKPEKPRVEHLAGLKMPTLIVQGERDALGNRAAVEGYELSPSIEVFWLVAGDHDLKPLKVSGFTHEQHLAAAASKVAGFLQ